jgi:hypothetical protein
MTITNMLLALVLGALVIIAYELRAILKQLAMRRDAPQSEREPREISTAGQTINVNLSPLQASVPGMTQVVIPAQNTQTAAEPPEAEAPQTDNEPEEAKLAREREQALARKREEAQVKKAELVTATQSGLIAVKCPSCGAENSAYRNICFNCGNSL